jgi:hypothetical protein
LTSALSADLFVVSSFLLFVSSFCCGVLSLLFSLEAADNAEVNQTNDDNQQRVNATPSARRYARENGVNLAEVSPKTNDVADCHHLFD